MSGAAGGAAAAAAMMAAQQQRLAQSEEENMTPYEAGDVERWEIALVVTAFAADQLAIRFGLPGDDLETRCRSCGYILRGITEPRCPECGERI